MPRSAEVASNSRDPAFGRFGRDESHPRTEVRPTWVQSGDRIVTYDVYNEW